ncbi:glycoside hydrolase family 27 protein [Asticcacaulis sp. 201]|uniref:glycoside hydrolase family 27 protein n=1 Tax=Asticcacaulis sp. 201 TaxID=3028787 RepID=UPI0029166869|nr:glycoside hydrolase family 27 protein [Asticcacaulis sp. 201]MDV6332665.1 glycoside hydrolase family 27 protein [Asticcacaulis sp. 201]
MTFTPDRRGLLAGLSALPLATAAAAAPKKMRPKAPLLAATPPMGWNSWNSFATTITEEQALETAHIMAEKLLPHGYNIFTIDIQWYEPGATGYGYAEKPVPVMDDHGRLLPAPNRFPSAAKGGFTQIAAQVHALGLKFGIHLMRGIPRLAVERNLPILGTNVHARDIADTGRTCTWNPDMYGVDMTKPGAQAYYDSVFALYASWGVDFVKMDDMSRPYDANAPEIEAAHAAIVKTGRPIMLSLSPGETPVPRADHVRKYAQMWRISDDFWDEWPLLLSQFTRLENWNDHRAPGSWPDADMLPLGRLAMGQRDSKFTPAEQKTLMTLWSVARSPLIMGGDLRHLDDATLNLLTNDEVLAVNQNSHSTQPHFLADGCRFWTAQADNGDHYLAMFNTSDAPAPTEIGFDLKRIGRASARVRDLWARQNLGIANGRVSATVPSHGAVLYRLS